MFVKNQRNKTTKRVLIKRKKLAVKIKKLHLKTPRRTKRKLLILLKTVLLVRIEKLKCSKNLKFSDLKNRLAFNVNAKSILIL